MKPYYDSGDGIVIYHGDCLEVLPTLEAGSVDMVCCDLPYGLTACHWDSVIPLDALWEQYHRSCTKAAAIVLTASQPFTSRLVMSNLKHFRHEWIWRKSKGSNFANTCREPMKEHESVLVFSQGGWTYNKQMEQRTPAGASRAKTDFQARAGSLNYRQFNRQGRRTVPALRVPSSVQSFKREVGLHPTQKPVALCGYLLRTYSNEGDTVLDNSMGSGTTGVACVKLGRRFIGVEIEEKYAEIAVQRIIKAKAQGMLDFTEALR